MHIKSFRSFNHSAVLVSIFAFASVFMLTVPAPAADTDLAPAVDEYIAFEPFDYSVAEVLCGKGDAYIAVEAVEYCLAGILYDEYGAVITFEAFDDDSDGVMYGDEEEQDFDSLFDDLEYYNFSFIDTSFAWDNKTVNSGRFDYKTFGAEDVIRIPLVDPSHEKFYAHPVANQVTSRFGMRGNMWHYGTDVRLKTGDPVKCVLDGIVRAIQYDRYGYGNVVVVRHHNGLETLYGHLSKVTVKPNQTINAGSQVGLGGNTGRSTGPHLHFEIRYYGEPFNPEYIIDFNNYALKSDTLALTRDNFEYLTELRKTVYYTVRKGDNLGGIAKRYGTTVNNLCRLNGITAKTILSIGRKLVIRRGDDEARPAAGSAAPISANAQNAQAPAVTQDVSSDVFYTVRSGDTLSSIARRHGTTVNKLCNLNGVTPQTILSVGRVLVVKREP
jgi:murein DD-endopeptidase MepM/ murein hydrolase activator NlpD